MYFITVQMHMHRKTDLFHVIWYTQKQIQFALLEAKDNQAQQLQYVFPLLFLSSKLCLIG